MSTMKHQNSNAHDAFGYLADYKQTANTVNILLLLTKKPEYIREG